MLASWLNSWAIELHSQPLIYLQGFTRGKGIDKPVVEHHGDLDKMLLLWQCQDWFHSEWCIFLGEWTLDSIYFLLVSFGQGQRLCCLRNSLLLVTGFMPGSRLTIHHFTLTMSMPQSDVATSSMWDLWKRDEDFKLIQGSLMSKMKSK